MRQVGFVVLLTVSDLIPVSNEKRAHVRDATKSRLRESQVEYIVLRIHGPSDYMCINLADIASGPPGS